MPGGLRAESIRDRQRPALAPVLVLVSSPEVSSWRVMTKLTLTKAKVRGDSGPGGPTISSSKQIVLVLAVLASRRGGESRAKQRAFVSYGDDGRDNGPANV